MERASPSFFVALKQKKREKEGIIYEENY